MGVRFSTLCSLVYWTRVVCILASRHDKHNLPSAGTLLIDVDNTLYREAENGIEAQIIEGIQAFAIQELDHLEPTQAVELAESLHKEFGSTIEGLRKTHYKNKSPLKQLQHDFYEQVYSNIDVSRLLLLGTVDEHGDQETHTGYTMAASQQLRQVLLSIGNELHIASNSPTKHIEAVIQAMGLARVPWKKVWSPDSKPTFPTKAQPTEYWGKTFLKESRHVTLIDDSMTVLDAVRKQTEIETVRVSSDSFPYRIEQALAVACGWVSLQYTFSDTAYLRSKNEVDRASINPDIWTLMLDELMRLLDRDSRLVIADVGAGLIGMLRLFIHGSNDSQKHARLQSLNDKIAQSSDAKVHDIHYYAYEPNRMLETAIVEELESLGFELENSKKRSADDIVFARPGHKNSPSYKVHVRFCDYRKQQSEQVSPHLIVGCCFADLMEPSDLVPSLLHRFLSRRTRSRQSLVYFPITFWGVTQCIPPQPFESDKSIPSDTFAFSLYSKSLVEKHGHNMDWSQIEKAMTDYGGTMLGRGKSDWSICPSSNAYLWNTMLYFFGTVAAPEVQASGWDAKAWMARIRSNSPNIHVSNVDLLFRLPHIGEWRISDSMNKQSRVCSSMPKTYNEICFKEPRVVESKKKRSVPLRFDEVRIQTECSLVSSGTELKIFRGDFDDAALDVNIDGMNEERMSYPLAYGYSSVGRVVECGENVEDADSLLGRLVFSFSPHASQVVTARNAVVLVPEGILPLDAIFMPSIETALSIVQDAHPCFGENVGVFGQGLIGLLITAILKLQSYNGSALFGTVSTFDTLPDRLAASAAGGATQALFPSSADEAGPFDVAIEVSGNSGALQAAIDNTKNGGRIIVGSWYGNKDITLQLGIDFHRSHKTIKASQVSEIAPKLQYTWTKNRRFKLAWELVKTLGPSKLLTLRISLDKVQEAYSALDAGQEIAVAIEYTE